jgi:hypothetical protein
VYSSCKVCLLENVCGKGSLPTDVREGGLFFLSCVCFLAQGKSVNSVKSEKNGLSTPTNNSNNTHSTSGISSAHSSRSQYSATNHTACLESQ